MSLESVMPANHLVLYRPLLLLPSIFPSIRAFSNESAPHIRWPKYWSLSFSISPSNEYIGLISFRMDWLALHTYLILFKPYNSICEVGVATLHLQTKDQRFREFNMHKGAKDKVGFESNSRPRAPTGRYL